MTGRWVCSGGRVDIWRPSSARLAAACGLDRANWTYDELAGQLAEPTAQNITMADKAYSSFATFEPVGENGRTPYIAFKVNDRGDPRPGSVWETMFAHFTLNRDDYLAHYHRRSNVESTFSMIKRKFGDRVRAKTDVAMRNEVPTKVVCHNFVVVIYEMHELGIDPAEFGSPTGEPDVLRFPGVRQNRSCHLYSSHVGYTPPRRVLQWRRQLTHGRSPTTCWRRPMSSK